MGYNYREVLLYADRLKHKLEQQKRVRKLYMGSNRNPDKSKEFAITVSKEKLARNHSDIGSMLVHLNRLSGSGDLRTEAYIGQKRSTVVIRPEERREASLWDLQNRPLQGDKSVFRLGDVGELREKYRFESITKANQEYEVLVQYDFIGDYMLSNKVKELVINEMNREMPIGFRVKEGNEWRSYFWEGAGGIDARIWYIVLVISLAGLIIGVGMMVDNSIIVIDNIHQYRERGYSLEASCNGGTVEIIRPLLSSVLTTCAVFIPLIFLGGLAGALFYDQALAVSIGLFVSLIVSISIVPVVFHLLFGHTGGGRMNRLVERISFKHLEEYYTKGYRFVFYHRGRSFFVIAVLLVAGFTLLFFLKTEQMPPLEINEMLVKTDWNSSIHADENQQRVNDVIALFGDKCEEMSCFSGEKQFFMSREENQELNEAEFYVKTKDNKSLEQLLKEMQEYIRKKYPEARVELYKVKNLFEQLFSDELAPLVMNLSGMQKRELPSVDSINRFIVSLNRQLPGLGLNPVATAERVAIHFLPERLALYHVDQQSVIYELEKNISKSRIGKLNTGSRYIPIVITENVRTLGEILRNTDIVTRDGSHYIPAESLVVLSTDYDYKKIVGKKEGVVVPVEVYPGENKVEEIVEVVRREARMHGLDVHFEGSLLAGNQTVREMGLIIIVAILMLYFILAAQFESLSLPLIVLSEIPIDIAFTALVLWVCGISLNLMSLTGIIVMCGIIINDSILKIDTILRLEKEGYPLSEAIHEGGVRRLKPILMTSLTSIMAMVPLLWGNDIGSQLQRPLAITMISGMSFGTLVSLYFVPLCYYGVRVCGRSFTTFRRTEGKGVQEDRGGVREDRGGIREE